MSRTNYTPKNWKAHQPDTQTLAVVTPRGSLVEWPTNYIDEDVIDARLIAAAPDLMAALRRAIIPLRMAVDSVGSQDLADRLREAYDAIAKAVNG